MFVENKITSPNGDLRITITDRDHVYVQSLGPGEQREGWLRKGHRYTVSAHYFRQADGTWSDINPALRNNQRERPYIKRYREGTYAADVEYPLSYKIADEIAPLVTAFAAQNPHLFNQAHDKALDREIEKLEEEQRDLTTKLTEVGDKLRTLRASREA